MNNIAANIKSILYNQNNKVLDTKIFSNDSNYAAFKALERMVKKGEVKRAEKGLYYIPQKSIFGELPLSVRDFIQKYLYIGDKRIGYITGVNLFNRYGVPVNMKCKKKIKVNANF